MLKHPCKVEQRQLVISELIAVSLGQNNLEVSQAVCLPLVTCCQVRHLPLFPQGQECRIYCRGRSREDI